MASPQIRVVPEKRRSGHYNPPTLPNYRSRRAGSVCTHKLARRCGPTGAKLHLRRRAHRRRLRLPRLPHPSDAQTRKLTSTTSTPNRPTEPSRRSRTRGRRNTRGQPLDWRPRSASRSDSDSPERRAQRTRPPRPGARSARLATSGNPQSPSRHRDRRRSQRRRADPTRRPGDARPATAWTEAPIVMWAMRPANTHARGRRP